MQRDLSSLCTVQACVAAVKPEPCYPDRSPVYMYSGACELQPEKEKALATWKPVATSLHTGQEGMVSQTTKEGESVGRRNRRTYN